MKISDLSLLLTIAEKGGITRAAETLYTTQPALSRKLAEIEDEIGCPLFERTTRRLKPTPEGEILLQSAKRIVTEYRTALDAIQSHGKQRRSILRCGYTPLGGYPLYLARTVEEMSRTHSEIEMEIQRFYPPQLIEHLLDETLDCCLITDTAIRHHRDAITCRVLQDLWYWLVVPADHPFALQKSVDFSSLADTRVIMLSSRCAPNLHQSMAAACCFAGFELQDPLIVEDVEELLLSVRAHRLPGIMTGPLGTRFPELHSLPLSGSVPTHKRVLAWRTNDTNPALFLFEQTLQDMIHNESVMN